MDADRPTGDDQYEPSSEPQEPSPQQPTVAAGGQRPVVLIAAIAVGAVVIGVVVGFLLGRTSDGNDEGDTLLFGEDDSDPEGGAKRPPPIMDEPPASTAPDDAEDSEDDVAQAARTPRSPECPPEEGAAPDERHMWWTDEPPMCIDPEMTYTATLATDRGDIVISLDSDEAPTTVNNFVFLARWGFYDGMDFHAVIPGSSILTGDPAGEPPENRPPGYTVEGELPTEEPYYPLNTVAMGIAGEPGVHDSVFFIVTGAGSQTPPNYSRFGYVTRGQTVVEEIDATGVRRASTDRTPRERTVIERVTIEEA